jgi:hypothetical protein
MGFAAVQHNLAGWHLTHALAEHMLRVMTFVKYACNEVTLTRHRGRRSAGSEETDPAGSNARMRSGGRALLYSPILVPRRAHIEGQARS